MKSLAKGNIFSLDVGCGDHPFGDVNIDSNLDFVGYRNKPTVLASALKLPFKEASFGRAFLLETLEHFPSGTESDALMEIRRVLSFGGQLILSVPNDRGLYKWLDPSFYFLGHRHYSTTTLQTLLETCGFRVAEMFTRGGFWMVVILLVSALFKGARMKYSSSGINRVLMRFNERDYRKATHEGYTIFCLSRSS